LTIPYSVKRLKAVLSALHIPLHKKGFNPTFTPLRFEVLHSDLLRAHSNLDFSPGIAGKSATTTE
jgi:hypothetical protein